MLKTLQASHCSDLDFKSATGAAMWKVDCLEKSGALEVGSHQEATAIV